jgi:branched-chain amino acid transport system substrate-binding protein
MRNPIPALVYLQYGAMHEAFVAATGPTSEGIIVGTVVGLLPDAMGRAVSQRYRARFGDSSTPSVGAQTYVALHHYALAAALAGGTAPPGSFVQNRRIAQNLKDTIYRSVVGTIRYDRATQSAFPYPNVISDPSLGMPHLFFQIQRSSFSWLIDGTRGKGARGISAECAAVP